MLRVVAYNGAAANRKNVARKPRRKSLFLGGAPPGCVLCPIQNFKTLSALSPALLLTAVSRQGQRRKPRKIREKRRREEKKVEAENPVNFVHDFSLVTVNPQHTGEDQGCDERRFPPPPPTQGQ